MAHHPSAAVSPDWPGEVVGGSLKQGGVPVAKNAPTGDNRRIGAVRDRSQTQTPSGNWVKRGPDGRFMDVKTSSKTPFKGVRKEK
jgi:hypothetical protein